MFGLKTKIPVCCAAVALTLLCAACAEEQKEFVSHPTDPETTPTMVSRDVKTVISEEGHTRYRIITPLWNLFEEAELPHWTFPDGVTAEELDDNYKTTTTLKCDSAYYDKRANIWHLYGNVRITNTDGDVILTNWLDWDQNAHKIHSESFIHVEKKDRVIEGYGYESNETFTSYRLHRVEAILPIEESRFPHPNS